MARQCDVCGKGAQLGNQVTTRGKKKYLGGVGTKVTGITPPQVQAEPAARERDDPQRQQGDPRLHPVPPERRGDEGRPRRTVQVAAKAGEGKSDGELSGRL